MKRKKLLKTLAALLDKEGRKQRKHRDGLEALLAKLKGKEIELEQKLRAEKDGRKQQRLSTELEIFYSNLIEVFVRKEAHEG